MSDSSPSFKPNKREEHYEKAAYICMWGFFLISNILDTQRLHSYSEWNQNIVDGYQRSVLVYYYFLFLKKN